MDGGATHRKIASCKYPDGKQEEGLQCQNTADQERNSERSFVAVSTHDTFRTLLTSGNCGEEPLGSGIQGWQQQDGLVVPSDL
jgi:hypothetical protein